MLLPSPEAHLAYCTNIHPAHTWPDTLAQLQAHLPAVKRRVSPDARMGVGLRLSADAARQLRTSHLDEFGAWLRDEGLYVFTINGFVHGAFHRTSVKESVYRPDWSEEARLEYTVDLIDIAAALVPESLDASISTVPVAFGDPSTLPAMEAVQARLLQAAERQWQCAQDTGRIVRIALEPEPMCHLETVAQTVEFFQSVVFSAAATKRFATMTGLSETAAEEVLRRHLGVCIDTCHAAVEFEDPRGCLDALRSAGIEIPKIQVTTGLELDPRQPGALEALAPYAEDVYLHQVVIEHPDRLERVRDLPEALAAAESRPVDQRGTRWRVHFHIPVFEDALPPFRNTQTFLRQCLDHARATGVTSHLEVETYTWDVLPPAMRTSDVDDAIAAEMLWVANAWSE